MLRFLKNTYLSHDFYMGGAPKDSIPLRITSNMQRITSKPFTIIVLTIVGCSGIKSGTKIRNFMWELFCILCGNQWQLLSKQTIFVCKAMKYDYFLLFTDFISGAAMDMDVRNEFSWFPVVKSH